MFNFEIEQMYATNLGGSYSRVVGFRMRTIDWDWPAQLNECQIRIAELEDKISSQKQKVQRLLDRQMTALSAQRLLVIWEQSLERVRSHKHLIESRIAERAADQQHGAFFSRASPQVAPPVRLEG
jgi:hypothetical protein